MFRSFFATALPCFLLATACGVSDPEVPLGADATSSHGHADAAAGDSAASPLHSGQVVVSVLANWYDYDPATHATSSRGEVYCVRDAGGRYGSVHVVAYGSGEITVGFRHRADGDHWFQ